VKVLLISHTCQSRTEGQPRAYELAALPGIDLQVLVPNRWRRYGTWRTAETPESARFGFKVGRVSLPWAGRAQGYLHFYLELGTLLKTFRPDIIDLWEEPWSLISAQTCALRNWLLPGARIVSETEQNISRKLPPPFEQFRGYTLANANFVVGRSAGALDVVRDKGYRGPAAVIGNGVDTNLFRPFSAAAREAERKKQGLTGFVVGYVGRLVKEKGLMDLLDAMTLCPPDVSLLFVGSGPFLASLQHKAAESFPDSRLAAPADYAPSADLVAAGSRVRFLAGRSLEELPAVMNALDALVLPSHTGPTWKEQFGRVIIEAHACGLPVIGSDSGAIPEVVGDGGLIAAERSPAAIARAIGRLASLPDRGRSLGDRGREQVARHYRWQQIAARLNDIYQEVVQPGGALVQFRPV
jgi:glycosyltransferase involved in cell wall biosynthesis